MKSSHKYKRTWLYPEERGCNADFFSLKQCLISFSTLCMHDCLILFGLYLTSLITANETNLCFLILSPTPS